MAHEDQEETHLGDGVYASFDGYQIWLRVERPLEDWVVKGIRKLSDKDAEETVTVSERVAIDSGTLARLNKYAEDKRS